MQVDESQGKINIAFGLFGDDTWTFGKVYLNDLLGSLKRYNDNRFKFFIFISDPQKRDFITVSDISFIHFNSSPKSYLSNPLLLFKTVFNYLFLKKYRLHQMLKKNKIAVFFAPSIEYSFSHIKTLSWIPDFQHIQLPDMFSDNEILDRNRRYRKAAKYSSRIILISETAKRDFEVFAPEYTSKVRILPPISLIESSIYSYSLNHVLIKFNLPEKFFFLPNQFWKHKNHCVVFEAIRILKERGIEITVVCAGISYDYRNPNYFSNVSRKISEWKIRNQIIYIGVVPRSDVLGLIRQSIGVINPSLFEGFGFTVEEARSIGKRVILSDIPAHREQNPPKSSFFPVNNVDLLADILEQIWSNSIPGPDEDLEKCAQKEYSKRLQANVEIFLNIVEEALKE